jgi:hypothetical protein
MRQGEAHVGMIARQQARSLEGEPALRLEQRALGAGPVSARVRPDTGDVAVGTRLEMAAQSSGPALHEQLPENLSQKGFVPIRG